MNLYKSLSLIYHEMYQNLFDYEKEFDVYAAILNRFGAKAIIEYGCGTGNLARLFLKSGYTYLGVDLSQEMLTIATQDLPKENFTLGNLKTYEADKVFDSALITGRTISYLNTNNEVLMSFKNLAKNIKDKGILIFDAIDATSIFENFDERIKDIIVGNYKRISTSKPNMKTGWTWDWDSEYFEKKGGTFKSLGKDQATVRAFTKDEIKLFLKMSGFELLEVLDKETYMWQDRYFVARKK